MFEVPANSKPEEEEDYDPLMNYMFYGGAQVNRSN